MLKALTRAGLGPIEAEVQLIQYAATYGFDGVEVDPCKLVNEIGIDKAITLFQEQDITAAAFALSVNWQHSEETFQRELLQLPHRAYTASQLGCKVCTTYILPSTDQDVVPFSFHTVRRLRTCAQLLQPYGITLALEFVSPHHLRTAWKHPFIHTMDDTLSLIDAIALPNVGLLLDSYHWYCNEMTISQLQLLSPHQIAYVHINDAKALPVHELLDNDRLYPGAGVIDLQGFLQALFRIGYVGFVAQEILSPHTPTDNEQALTQICEGMNQVWPRSTWP